MNKKSAEFDAEVAKVGTQKFNELIDELMQRLSEGQQIDLDELCRQHPKLSEQLRQIYPVICAVASLDSVVDAHPGASRKESQGVGDFLAEQGTLGDFRIVREIGRGGMGIVYEAEQVSLQRRVALKVLPFAALLDERQLQRFQNEARAAAMLRHPNIVNVFHVGYDRGIYFYAMDLVDGQSLAQVAASLPKAASVKRSRAVGSRNDAQVSPTSDTVPVAQLTTHASSNPGAFYRSVARLGHKAAIALQAAHEQAIVHRDVKPSNLLLDRNGRLYLTDFGLARIASNELTVTGDLVGTLRYMSPEQIDGKKAIDHRTDIYSLGLTLYELATGHAAFPAEGRAELLMQIRDTTPVPPSKLAPQIPRDLETIIAKSMERNPAARYESASDMAEDLDRFLSQRPILARRISQFERTRRWVVANPVVAGLIGTVAVLLMAIAIGSSSIAMQLSVEAKAREIAVYARDIRLAQQAVEEGRRLDAETALLKWVPQNGSTDHRGFEWYHLWQACHDPALVHTIQHQIRTHSLDFLADTNKLAIGAWDKKIRICDVAHGYRVTCELDTEQINPVRHVRFLHDTGSLLSIDANGTTVEWDCQQQRRLKELDLPLVKAESNAFNSDLSTNGRLLAIGGGNDSHGTLIVFERETWQPVWKIENGPGLSWTAFAADGNLLVLHRGTDRVSLYDSNTWQMIDERTIESGFVRAATISPDRRRLAIATYRQRGIERTAAIEIWDVAERRVIEHIPMSGIAIRCLRFSPDGKWLAAGAHHENWVCLFDEHYETVARIQPHAGTVSDVAFSPDGQFLTTAGWDGAVHFWSLPKLLRQRKPRIQLRQELQFGLRSDFVDDDTVCSPSGTGELLLWNVHSGDVDRRIPLDAGDYNAVNLVLSHDRKLCGVSMGYWPDEKKPGRVQIIDLQTRQEVFRAELPRGLSAGEKNAFSCDRHYFAVLYHDWLTVLDLSGQDEPREFQFPCNLKSIDFTPDDQIAVVVGTNGMIYQLGVPSFKIQRVQRGDERLLVRSDISPDSTRLAVVGFDRRANLFDAWTLNPLGVGFSHATRYLVDVQFSPDGKRILTSSPDGKIQLWHAESGDRLLTFSVKDGWYPRVAFSPNGKTLAITSGSDSFAIHSADQKELKTLTYDELYDIACQYVTEQ